MAASAFAPLRSFDLDLRLSAARSDVYGLELADAAASAIVTGGRLSATLMEAAAYGGRLQGEVGAAYVGRDLELSARGELADADLSAAIADFTHPILTGTVGRSSTLEASGASPAAAISSLTGTASLEATDGSILGVNLEEALRRNHRRPIDAERDIHIGGGTPFDKVEASLGSTGGALRSNAAS